MDIPNKPCFRVDEVAAILSVHTNTIYKWIEAGDLEAFRLPGGDLRIARSNILAVFRQSQRRMISKGIGNDKA